MKMPDKVYVKKEKNNAVYSFSTQYNNSGEKYIRKGALIKWLEEVRAISHENAIARDLAFQEIVNKLNSI